MDALTLLMSLMLTLSEPCIALPDTVTQLGSETYRVERYRCGETSLVLWTRRCNEASPVEYWTRPFLMENERTGEGIYLNRFAELQAGWHVKLDEIYQPACGV